MSHKIHIYKSTMNFTQHHNTMKHNKQLCVLRVSCQKALSAMHKPFWQDTIDFIRYTLYSDM